MKKRILIVVAAVAVLAAAVIGGGAAYVHSLQDNGRFLSGTLVDQVDVSGKTPEEARDLFTKEFLDKQVVVEENGKEVLRHSLTELGYTVDEDAVEKLLGQYLASEKKDFDTVMKGLSSGNVFQMEVPCKTDKDTFNGAVNVKALSVPRVENQDAKILYYKEENECRIQPEVQGTELEDEELQNWLKGEIDAALAKIMQEQDAAQQKENTTAAAAAAAEKAEADTVAAENAEINAAAAESAASGTTDTETASGSADGKAQAGKEKKDKGEESREIVCDIPASLYIPPKKKADDEKLVQKCQILNDYADETVTYVFGDQTEKLTFETFMDWLKIKDGKVSVKEDKVAKYVRKLAEKYETRYMDRVFQTSLGTTVTFPAGLNEYGYTILEDLEAQQLTQDILSGESVEREPVYQYLGPWGDPLYLRRSGTDDLAGTYVEVSISAQHMWYYINGALFIESDVVTGDATLGQDTATGVFPLAFKESPATLRGGEGKNKYTTKVQYWMPFYEGQGLHDAWWKTVFGGNEYMGNGSHGCVNLPSSVAEAVYNNIEPGTAIIIYY